MIDKQLQADLNLKIKHIILRLNAAHEAVYLHKIHIEQLDQDMTLLHGILIELSKDLKVLNAKIVDV